MLLMIKKSMITLIKKKIVIKLMKNEKIKNLIKFFFVQSFLFPYDEKFLMFLFAFTHL